MSRVFSLKDVAEHGTKEAPWVIIHDKVYDLTNFISKHPGGEKVLVDEALGRDATEAFEKRNHSENARKWMKDFEIGSLGGQPKKWYQCGLYQAIAVTIGVVGVAVIIGVVVTKAKQ